MTTRSPGERETVPPNAVEAILQVIPVVLLEVSKELRDAWLDGREPNVTEESFRARIVELIRSGGVQVADIEKLQGDLATAEARLTVYERDAKEALEVIAYGGAEETVSVEQLQEVARAALTALDTEEKD